ncbi:hypothetical protein Tco_0098778 [Tanacetum coccineum]
MSEQCSRDIAVVDEASASRDSWKSSRADQIALDGIGGSLADDLRLRSLCIDFWASAYVHNRSKFEEPPLEKEILAFLASLGHSGEIRKITDVNVNKLHQPWRSFAAIINKCLSGTSLPDREQKTKKGNAMYYPCFTKLVVNFVMEKRALHIPRRNKINWIFARDEPRVHNNQCHLRMKDTQVVRGTIPPKKKNNHSKEAVKENSHPLLASGSVQMMELVLPPGVPMHSDDEDDDEHDGDEKAQDDDDEEQTESEDDDATCEEIKEMRQSKIPTYNLDGEMIVMTDSSSVSSGFVSNMLNPNQDTGVDDIFGQHTEATSLIDTPVTAIVEPSFTAPTNRPPTPNPLVIQIQQPPILTPATTTSSSLQNLPNFASLFGFDYRLKALEDNFSELRQTNQYAEALSSIPGIVDQYLANKMQEAVDVAVQLKYDRIREESNTANQQFLDSIDEGMKKIIKEQEANTSHAVAANLSELELKKILIDKMEANNSINSRRGLNIFLTGFNTYMLLSPDHAGISHVPATNESVQPWLSYLARDKPSESFDELTDNSFDFSAFMMNRLNVQTLTPFRIASRIIYEIQRQKNRLMRIDEYTSQRWLTLDDVRRLNLRLMDSIKGGLIMRSLERFVGDDP